MVFILLSILCNVLLLVILKSFDRFRVHSFQGIVINYFVAGSVAYFFIPEKINFTELIHSPWMSASLPLGALFICIFYLISLTAQKIGISVASVANKMSVVIPVCFAFYFYKDSAGWIKIAGLVLALFAVYFTVKTEKKTTADKKNSGWFLLLLPVLTFLGSGAIDTLVTYSQKTYLTSPSATAKFIAFSFYVAGSIGALFIITAVLRKKMKFELRSIVGGIILGVPNYFSIYFIMLAIAGSGLESSVIYPIVNMGVVLGSALFGVFMFREKLSKWNYLGILLSIIAIAMISLKEIVSALTHTN
ncbi:MAG: EamA/RhaT family transporter [Bacteroidia bacterium]|nr:EamA/RhaT family transporter [Bacteroidia bacterium]